MLPKENYQDERQSGQEAQRDVISHRKRRDQIKGKRRVLGLSWESKRGAQTGG